MLGLLRDIVYAPPLTNAEEISGDDAFKHYDKAFKKMQKQVRILSPNTATEFLEYFKRYDDSKEVNTI